MRLTPYDKRQLQHAQRLFLYAQRQVGMALDDNDPSMRCLFASKYAAEAALILARADRRIAKR